MYLYYSLLHSLIFLLPSLYGTSDALSTPAAHECSTAELNTLSCSPESLKTDRCCVESPGGLLLHTQIYNWNPGLGPDDTWTIHGLWNDYCNGSYPNSCDPSRAYTNLPEIFKHYDLGWLVEYFEYIWKNDAPVTGVNGTDTDLWAHEWSKHGTCLSTLHPSCYAHYSAHEELIDYFLTTFEMYKALPTNVFLSLCGIVPTNDTTYTLKEIEDCLTTAAGGFVPHMGCSQDGYLNEIWYHFRLRGKIKNALVGEYGFEGTNSTFPSKCPTTGIKYPPKLNQAILQAPGLAKVESTIPFRKQLI